MEEMRIKVLGEILGHFLARLKSSLWRGRTLIFLLVLAVLFFGGRFLYEYLNEPLPTITLQSPAEGEEVISDDLFVRGRVSPLGSKILVNDQKVSLNGDGTFTAILKIPEGKMTIRVTAEKRGQAAEVLRLVKRKLSPEEELSRKEAEEKAKAEARARILSQNQQIAQVQAAYTQKEVKKVRVIEHELRDDYGLKRVVGRVVNDTDEPAYWVKVTATFLNASGGTVDTKIAFVSSFDKFLKPGETVSFETQSVEAPVDHYQLEVSWEKE